MEGLGRASKRARTNDSSNTFHHKRTSTDESTLSSDTRKRKTNRPVPASLGTEPSHDPPGRIAMALSGEDRNTAASSIELLPKDVTIFRNLDHAVYDPTFVRQRSRQPAAERTTLISNGSGILTGAHNFTMNNVTVVDRDQSTVHSAMKLLSERIIPDAAFDSAARDPPPLCHPGTRVELKKRIETWLYDNRRQKALLWLRGPAGVGKSAIIQTLAESLAASAHLGAALFLSRPNDRNDPQRIVITIAYQLAVKIPAYRSYIAEQIALDPNMLHKVMREQFRIFIIEPFFHRKIGEGGDFWGVLLDGLDECDGQDQQSEIIQLISKFVLNFPDAPLVWVISSRPEPHIVVTFDNEACVASHWREHVPIDSTQACKDVELFLGSRFNAIRKCFPHAPPTWPNETQLSKLSNAASGLFVYATTATLFIGDADYADPVSRLNLVLSVVDRFDVAVTGDHPFAPLDELYTKVLESIPSKVWTTTKRVLGYALCVRGVTISTEFEFRLQSDSFKAAAMILGLEETVVYASLHKLHSVLKIPHPNDTETSGVSFLHASFADYLTDSARSNDFYIDLDKSMGCIVQRLFKIGVEDPQYSAYISGSRFLTHAENSALRRNPFRANFIVDVQHASLCLLTGVLLSNRGGPFLSQEHRLECLDVLSQVNIIHLLWREFSWCARMARLLYELWQKFPEELTNRGLAKEVPLRDLDLDNPICKNILSFETLLNDPTNTTSLMLASPAPYWLRDALRKHQQKFPEMKVVVFGVSTRKCALFCMDVEKKVDEAEEVQHYCIPYPD